MVEHALIVSPAAFEFGTRSRKAALAFSDKNCRVTYVAPAKVGRTGRWGKPGTWTEAGVRVHQVHTREPKTDPTFLNRIRNLLLSYIPAFLRMLSIVIRTPADLIFVNGPSLVWLGLVHKLAHRSILVLDIPERPGVLGAKGSLATLVSRMDIFTLKVTARFVNLMTVVTYADVDLLKRICSAEVALVRNVPMQDWRAAFRLPPITADTGKANCLSAVAMGSIFEGRGYEKLIEAIYIASKRIPVCLKVCGPARASYQKSLQTLVSNFGLENHIEFSDAVPAHKVSEAYLNADLGMVLYESSDPGNDGLSNKLFECVTSGRPVIASDLPENRQFVESTQVGWLAETTSEGIASALVSAYQPARLASLAEHCREVGDATLNWEEEFVPVFKLLVNR